METNEVIQSKVIEQPQTQQVKQFLSENELKRLTDFFSILIQIDQKNKSRVKKNDNI